MALVAPINGARIAVPPAGQVPPTREDVGAAVDYVMRLQQHRKTEIQPTPTLEEIGNVHVHLETVTAKHVPAEVAPGWFQAALDDALAPIKEELVKTGQTLVKIQRENAIARNTQCGDGLARPFEIITTKTNEDPTKAPHNLPHLNNTSAICNLSHLQVSEYITQYDLDTQVNAVPNCTYDRKKIMIAQYVGCYAVLFS
ncbi:hypothetical protein EXIGLDRAFT_745637 [Exidia glandulosa HHB12029]|uniref:Mug135-like C-terminal domain-containing protein n=1 Tax=Exidia glandulosa HHB12029 TaxID=1314781 RepID=A0A165N861_EXIGL|nr:hypothetical protein EXIGLDRAFT_745637 [Exidia glandulosa HHB12029]